MTEISNNSLGIELFPEFKTLYALISSEVNGLDDAQLDFTSDKWGWSEWSIRMQLSHMASLIPRWLPDGARKLFQMEIMDLVT